MSKTLDFIFDFGSPNAYLSYKALPPLLKRTGATLNIIPCLLGGIFKATGNQSPAMHPAKAKYMHLDLTRVAAEVDINAAAQVGAAPSAQ